MKLLELWQLWLKKENSKYIQQCCFHKTKEENSEYNSVVFTTLKRKKTNTRVFYDTKTMDDGKGWLWYGEETGKKYLKRETLERREISRETICFHVVNGN